MDKHELLSELTEVGLAYVTCMGKIERLESVILNRYGTMEALGNTPSVPELQEYQILEEDRQALHMYAMHLLTELGLTYTRDSSLKVIFDNADIDEIIADRRQPLDDQQYSNVLTRARKA